MALLQKTSTVEALVNLIIDRIHDGEYKPAEKLPSERHLQEELAVGRLALREALSRLNAMGIITTSHGRGTYVQGDIKSRTFRNVLVPYFALNSTKRLSDLVVARGMLESEIAGIAAVQRTEQQLVALTAVVEQDFDQDTPLEEVARQDLLFHRMLAESIDHSFLATMHEALTHHIRQFLREYVKTKKNPAAVMKPHLPILHAIEKKDAEAARQHARRHVSYSSRDYESYMEQSKNGRRS